MEKQLTFYGQGLPYLKGHEYSGILIVIEGADCSGRSWQVKELRTWLERSGHAVLDTGLRRSGLIGDAILEAKQGNTLGKRTLGMLYATDFADQLENKILPALRAGFVVLADRYIFTLMARDLVRGASKDWLRKLFGFAPIPHLIFYLQVDPQVLLYRSFEKYGFLDYWESGMDICLSGDIFESFQIYQSLLARQYDQMAEEFNFTVLDGQESPLIIQKNIRRDIQRFLEERRLETDVK
ncbi:dTMP kinase [Desulforamulus ruminis]|uniref:Thymidylate kinase n=1 Tax=Desulforamulus ruminis (strain ATCC 23193 / DSM 2154 / NCIMB 8452 / DL) TaxID=696281 RepID=F6DSM1_DESRL|nr:thymidylate kinase [Desulforamulus ruminis]AEG61111.1 thymidylate kinase [Desulforamulus ruminis DSM 2154]